MEVNKVFVTKASLMCVCDKCSGPVTGSYDYEELETTLVCIGCNIQFVFKNKKFGIVLTRTDLPEKEILKLALT